MTPHATNIRQKIIDSSLDCTACKQIHNPLQPCTTDTISFKFNEQFIVLYYIKCFTEINIDDTSVTAITSITRPIIKGL